MPVCDVIIVSAISCAQLQSLLSKSVLPLLFFFTRSGVFLFIWGSEVFIENLGFVNSGQIFEIYAVLLYSPFKITIIS